MRGIGLWMGAWHEGYAPMPPSPPPPPPFFLVACMYVRGGADRCIRIASENDSIDRQALTCRFHP